MNMCHSLVDMACCDKKIVISSRYYRIAYHPSFGKLLTPGNKWNLGLTSGREDTFPRNLCFKEKHIKEMARSGLMWRGLDGHSQTKCIFCDVKVKWRPGLVVDEKHRKLSPDCPWLARRDRGKDMELHRNWKMPRKLCMKYHKDGKIDIVCIKCDVSFPHLEISCNFNIMHFCPEWDKIKEMHDRLSPNCP